MKKISGALRWGLLLAALLAALCTFAAAAEYTAASPQDIYNLFFEKLRQQDDYFSVLYTGDPSLLPKDQDGISLPQLAREMTANLPNIDGTGPDTDLLNIREMRCTSVDNMLAISITYLQDPTQLAWVNAKADAIIESLQLDGLSDYRKIKAIYEYMGTNFVYDHTLQKFTDYEGLTTGSMVCQGYALLTYKLCWKAGLPCRIVVGFSNGENHGWNMVQLDGKWYYLDTTWDAADEGTPMYWNYFLKSEADFVGHVSDVAYTSSYFTTNYPLAEASYPVPNVQILIDGTAYSGLTIRNGKTTQLEATLDPQSKIPVIWETTDANVVSVTQEGLIESLTPGSVFITATAEDENYIPASFAVTAVDLRSCSAWADEDLNSYYLRKLYPAELCSNYQNAITREEFAHLLYLLMSSYNSTGGQYQFPGFEDVTGSPYWMGIVYTASRGIFAGTGEKTFSPQMELTREQAAKLLCTVLDFMKIELVQGEPKSFTDEVEISDWAKDYVARASAAGLMLGDGDAFAPKTPITREEAAVTLERLFVNFIEPNLPKAETPAA